MCYLPVLVLGIPSQYLVAKYSNESALLSVQLYQPVYIYQVPVPLQYIGNMTAVVQAIAIAQLLHGYRRYDKAYSCTVGFPSLILLPVLLLVLQLQLVVYGSIGRRQLYQYSCTVQKSTTAAVESTAAISSIHVQMDQIYYGTGTIYVDLHVVASQQIYYRQVYHPVDLASIYYSFVDLDSSLDLASRHDPTAVQLQYQYIWYQQYRQQDPITVYCQL